MQFQLSSEPVVQISRNPPKRVVPRTRSKPEPEVTPRDRQLVHDQHVEAGYRPPPGLGETQPIQEDEEWFRHHFWKEKRKKVIAALRSVSTGPRQLDSFINCGSECVIEWNDTEKRYRCRGSFCHSRHCEPCMKGKASLLAKNLQERLEIGHHRAYRFVTLTLKHTRAPLHDQIQRLYASWKKLRNQPLWKKSQAGGAAMLEVKWIAKTRMWHPHLHIVTEGNFIDKNELSAAWHKATGDSMIVDIRALATGKDVAFYVAKYVTKGTNNEVWDDPEAAAEWIIAMKGTRTAATFASWRGYKLLKKPPESKDWKPVALLRNVARAARQGEAWAIDILLNLEEKVQFNPARERIKRQL